MPRYLAPVRCTPSGSAGHDHAFAPLGDGVGSRVPTVDGMEAVALLLHAADARLKVWNRTPPGSRARQAAPRPQEVEEQCLPTACIARRQADLSVNRQHRRHRGEHRSGFLSLVSRLPPRFGCRTWLLSRSRRRCAPRRRSACPRFAAGRFAAISDSRGLGRRQRLNGGREEQHQGAAGLACAQLGRQAGDVASGHYIPEYESERWDH